VAAVVGGPQYTRPEDYSPTLRPPTQKNGAGALLGAIQPNGGEKQVGAAVTAHWARIALAANATLIVGDGTKKFQLPQKIYPSSGRKDRLMRVTTASQERFSSWGYVRSKQWIAACARDEKLHRL